MTNPLVFLDCETTALRNGLPWEIAMIRIDDLSDGNPVSKIRMFILDPDLSEADPFALNVGQFYQRHPQAAHSDGALTDVYDEIDAMQLVEQWTRCATIVGANPAFDTEVLERRIRHHGGCPSWHHRLVDVENLVAGRIQLLDENRLAGLKVSADVMEIPYADLDLHTAMGDAELARRIFDEVFA
ncbi:hypothetical protein CH302_00960 [Rhodococcus sp. 15-2388-1-1a]|uniref:exonuclease domain-containing protein n=1 Tax=Nocardiaceae TaxID=85025 RepID=UPI00068AFF0B|nr:MULTISPECIES: exonuclease domain-containing protein [Rhodococcus]OZF05224.1 hypothetical protein CH302_00960 [Rhodococcus sp. 15-2388-1-1a]